jgi:hypothetical protein
MKPERNLGFRILYGSVVTCGIVVVALALYRLIQDQTPATWIVLAVLAGIAGSFSLKIPGINARVSAGDTITCLSILMLGPYSGAITAAMDAIVGSMRCKTSSRRLEFAFYNGSNSALSAFVVGHVLLRLPGNAIAHPQILPSASFMLALCVMAGIYFLINTILVTAVVSLEKSLNFFNVWQQRFMWTCANYVVGAFVAGVMAQVAGALSLAKLVVILFSCLAVHVSCRAYVGLARTLESREKAQPATQVASRAAS